MNNLWIFGDSFAYLHSNGDTWPRQISRKLDCELRCYAQGGSSLEYTYEQFNLARSQIKEHDIVILALTEINRRWAVRSHITESMLVTMQRHLNSEVAEAVKHYLMYLDNIPAYEAYLTNFLYNVEHITKQLSLKTVLLPCFESSSDIVARVKTKLITAQGNLYAVSQNEFMPEFTNRHSITRVSDLRANHLIHSNHTILADKIVKAITNNERINLCEDFQQHILCAENLRDTQFSERELFDIHLNTEEWNLHSF